MPNTSLVFLGAKRTAFGSFGGSLKKINPSELGSHVAKAALEQAKISPSHIDHVIFGSVLQSTEDSIYIARHIGLKAGIPIEVPALAVNRLCGTGFQVIIEAHHHMLAGEVDVALVGGVENMSLTPFVIRNARWGAKMGHGQIEDYLFAALTDTYCGCPMAITAENLATQYEISRTQADEYALTSQRRYQEALKKNLFDSEIAPLDLKNDEHPKPDTTLETLSKLKPVFKKDGLVTAGNASGIVDGATALVVSTEAYACSNQLKPLGRLLSYAVTGVDPKIMGIGPASAIRKALKKAQMSLSDIDLIEVNEAFAPQYLAVEKELGLDRSRTNVNGGAIALGHPLAASGSRIVAHLLYELKRQEKRYGLGSACIGGGQGIAMIVEVL